MKTRSCHLFRRRLPLAAVFSVGLASDGSGTGVALEGYRDGDVRLPRGTAADCFIDHEEFLRCCCVQSGRPGPGLTEHDVQALWPTCSFGSLDATAAVDWYHRCCDHLQADCPRPHTTGGLDKGMELQAGGHSFAPAREVDGSTRGSCFKSFEGFVLCCCSTRPRCFDELHIHNFCCSQGFKQQQCPERGNHDCWDDGFAPALCCDVGLYGPWGNLHCWHKRDDFERCCLGHEHALDPVAAAVRERSVKTGTYEYWERRYSAGGTSDGLVLGEQEDLPKMYFWRTRTLERIFTSFGATAGSHGQVADATHQSTPRRPSVLDLGVGDVRQAVALSCTGSVANITGLDISWHIIEVWSQKLRASTHDCLARGPIELHWYDGFQVPSALLDRQFDVAVSLQVIFHILEDDLFESYMSLLFSFARHLVIIHAPDVDEDLPSISHMRFRKFSRWVSVHQADWVLLTVLGIPADLGLDSFDGIHIFAHKSVHDQMQGIKPES